MYKTYADYMDEISADELFEGLLGYGLFATKCLRAFPRKHIIPIVKLTTRHMIKRNGINLQYIQIFVIQTYPVSWAFQPPCRTMQCALN